LKDGYQKLKDELPPSDHFKSSKVTLLHRGEPFFTWLSKDRVRSKWYPQPPPIFASSSWHWNNRRQVWRNQRQR
jgi:hypothetical protein